MNFEEYIEECNELELYQEIHSMGGIIWAIDHESADGRIDFRAYENKYNELQRRMKIAVKQTKRFGVEPLGDNDIPSKSYWKWYYKMKKIEEITKIKK